MRIENRETKSARLLDECAAYWALSGIPPRKVEEMRSELEQHLHDAARDDKPVETVVGDDAFLFAQSWAEENGPPRTLTRQVLDWLVILLVTTTAIMTAHHAFSWSLSFDVRWYTLVLILLPALGSAMLVSPRVFGRLLSIEPRWKRELVGFCGVALAAGAPIVLAVITGGSVGAPLFEWPWPATLISALTAIALWILRDDPSVPAYEDESDLEGMELNRGFIILALVFPVSTLAACAAVSLAPGLTFLLWLGVPGLVSLLFPPEGSARWRFLGAVMSGLGVLLTLPVVLSL